MSDGLVRLVWNVDPCGYEIVRRDVLRDRFTAVVPHPNGELVELGSYWELMGVGREFGENKRDDVEFIVPLSDPRNGFIVKEYQVGLLDKEIFRHLINSEQQPGNKGVLAFAKNWGLLTQQLVTPLETFLRLRSCIARAVSQVGEPVVKRRHWEEGVMALLDEVSRSGHYVISPHLEEHSILRSRSGLGIFGALHARFDTRKRALYFQADTL